MKIVWAPEARRQVHEIYHYIALDNPQAADRMVTRLVAAVEKLAHFPHLGRPGREGARELVVTGTKYIVIYKVERQEIRIGTVLHGAQRGRVKARTRV
jgi:toxin ParE1/3/4